MSELLNVAGLDKGITQLAETITATQGEFSGAAIIGIHTRGVQLAKRLLAKLSVKFGEIPFGTLDINLYRDDLSKISYHPVIKETRIEFPIDGKVLYLVDDVLFTGRTIRAAMDAIFDLGRPKAIKLVVAAVRDGRELPIEADFNIIEVPTKEGDNVKVKFKEIDGVDGVELL